MGDNVNHMTPFTFKGTGVSVFIKPVSPMLLNEVRKSVPLPVPPMEEIENADGTKRQELNEAHPSHARAMREYNARVNALSTRVIITRGVVLTMNDEQRAALASLRTEMSELGITLDADDKFSYILNLAVGTGDDVTDLVQAVTQRSQPTDPKSQSG